MGDPPVEEPPSRFRRSLLGFFRSRWSMRGLLAAESPPHLLPLPTSSACPARRALPLLYLLFSDSSELAAIPVAQLLQEAARPPAWQRRSEEHTSELQSR